MNLIRSLISRIDGVKNNFKSHYWDYVKYYSDEIIWDNSILIESFGGKNFQGNPYYIYKELISCKKYDKYDIYISVQNPKEALAMLTARKLIRDRVKIVETHSAEYRSVLSHSKFLVNNVSFTMDFIKKDEQVYLNTWHGTPLKYLGRRVQNDHFSVCNPQRNFLLSDYLIAPNELTKNVYLYDHMVDSIMDGEIVLTGYPRNSVFFDDKRRLEVKNKYNLCGTTSIFYMPTWRGNACGADEVDQIGIIEKLAKELGDSYKVYVKLHPAMQNPSGSFEYCHKMPDGVEVYEFLNAVDILITDYSSVFFDFANTNKPVILFQYDRKQYFKDRGVYSEVEDKLPFPIACSYDELIDSVRNVSKTDYSEFIDAFCKYDCKDSAADAIEILFKEKQKNQKNVPVDLYIIDFPVSEEEINRISNNLDGSNCRFVFVLNRKSNGFKGVKSWEQIDYCVLNKYNRLTYAEKIKAVVYGVIYSVIKSKRILKKLQNYGRREQKRLWGNMNIGHIYAKSRQIPVAVKYFAEAWPSNLLR